MIPIKLNPPLRSKEQYEVMKSREKPSQEFKNIVDQNIIDKILNVWEKDKNSDRAFMANFGGNKEDKTRGVLKFAWNWDEFGKELAPIISEIQETDDWEYITGRVYWVGHKNRLWDTIHTDNLTLSSKLLGNKIGPTNNNGKKFWNWALSYPNREYVPYRTIVIPLQYNNPVYTVTFNQYNHDWEAASWNKFKFREEYPGRMVDYSEYVEDLDKFSIDENTYNKYLKHIDRDVLKGLSVQNAHEWKVGSALTWDASQYHVSGYQPNGTEKIGLTIWLGDKKYSYK